LKLQEIIGEPDEDVYLIGHSIGCVAILRYLETLSESQKIAGVVFVAGFTENVGFDEIQNFFETSIDLEKIKTKSKNGFVAIHSDDDPYVDLKYADVFREKLGAEIIIKHNAKHFSGAIEGEDSCVELPDVILNVEKLANNINLNCIMIHGCSDSAEEMATLGELAFHWMPWTREKLEAQGVKVETPLMPESWEPDYEKFKAEFEKYEVDENTILVGHSCGCAFLVRWLGDTKQKIAKLILVAPWKIPTDGYSGGEAFYIYPIDETIKIRIGEIVMFTADNEAAEGKESLNIFHEALGGKIIELKKHGHYTLNDMGTNEFPELLEIIVG